MNKEIRLIKIYGFGATRSMRAVWAAKESGIEYEYVELNIKSAEHKDETFEKLNPNKTIPVLINGDFILWESTAILTYIGDLKPESNLVPRPYTKERAKYDQWMSFASCELDAYLFNIEKHTWRLPEDQRIPQVIELALNDLMAPIKVVTEHLQSNEYLLGDQFTMADIMMSHCLNWARYRGAYSDNEILVSYTKKLSKRDQYPRELYK